MLTAADVLLRVVASSVAEVEDIVNSPQLRVLVRIHNLGPRTSEESRPNSGVHASNATRICDRLVAADSSNAARTLEIAVTSCWN